MFFHVILVIPVKDEKSPVLDSATKKTNILTSAQIYRYVPQILYIYSFNKETEVGIYGDT